VRPPALGVTSSSLIFTNQKHGSTSAGNHNAYANNGGIIIPISAARRLPRTTTLHRDPDPNQALHSEVTLPRLRPGRHGAVTVRHPAREVRGDHVSANGVIPSAWGLTSSSLSLPNQAQNGCDRRTVISCEKELTAGISVSVQRRISRTNTAGTLPKIACHHSTLLLRPPRAGNAPRTIPVVVADSGIHRTISLSGIGAACGTNLSRYRWALHSDHEY